MGARKRQRERERERERETRQSINQSLTQSNPTHHISPHTPYTIHNCCDVTYRFRLHRASPIPKREPETLSAWPRVRTGVSSLGMVLLGCATLLAFRGGVSPAHDLYVLLVDLARRLYNLCTYIHTTDCCAHTHTHRGGGEGALAVETGQDHVESMRRMTSVGQISAQLVAHLPCACN
jgi:hypothetical protein